MANLKDLTAAYTLVNFILPKRRLPIIASPSQDSKYTRLLLYIDDREELLEEPTQQWYWTQSAESADDIIDKIVSGGYATDPEYKNKLQQVLATNHTGNNKKFYDKRYNSYISKGLSSTKARVYAAQDALESGYGKHLGGTYNYGGIKDFSGKGNQRTTTEYENGAYVTTTLPFRNFDSEDDYTDYKINLLKTRYGIQ